MRSKEERKTCTHPRLRDIKSHQKDAKIGLNKYCIHNGILHLNGQPEEPTKKMSDLARRSDCRYLPPLILPSFPSDRSEANSPLTERESGSTDKNPLDLQGTHTFPFDAIVLAFPLSSLLARPLSGGRVPFFLSPMRCHRSRTCTMSVRHAQAQTCWKAIKCTKEDPKKRKSHVGL